MVQKPSPEVLLEINQALQNNTGALGKVARAISYGVTSISEMVNIGAGAKSGHSGNLARVYNFIQDGNPPTAPSRAAIAGRSIGGLLRDNPGLSADAIAYLRELRQ